MNKSLNPAFPVHTPSSIFPGLSKREWFAGLAMQGLLADGFYSIRENTEFMAAEIAIKNADALIAKLEKLVEPIDKKDSCL